MDVDAGPGTQLHVDTPSATRLYRMPDATAGQRTRITVGDRAFVELLPEPYLPYSGSRFDHEGSFEVAESGTLIVGEVVGPGRQARGEELAYARFVSRIEVRRPAGELLFRDVCRLEPASGLQRPGLLGGCAAVGTLFAVGPNLGADVLAGVGCGSGWAGCSELPDGAGAWLRVLAPDSATAAAVVAAGWRAARIAVTGAAPPLPRRY
jgi:urease accessory protein